MVKSVRKVVQIDAKSMTTRIHQLTQQSLTDKGKYNAYFCYEMGSYPFYLIERSNLNLLNAIIKSSMSVKEIIGDI